ncbi:hypothetical protein IKE98_00315 [Candidatus Saccharibacteria bacterium]|nr:hypothetical protein [Candidatus Saccharibacteria bacterium]
MHKLNKNRKRRASYTYLGLGLIAAPAVISGVILSSANTSAVDTVVDDININVPLSCSVSASGMDSHTDTIANGTYVDDIGTTYMNIVCNDNAGFSIYATGFTGNEIGATNSNKLVGAATGGTIDTGTATSAGDPDVSNWAMKLEADAYDTYPITILSDYDYYHTVPGSYVKVATRLSATDAGEYPEGATLTSTYAAYISKTQGADTYSGKVKYTLVHPNTAPAPVVVNLALQDTVGVDAAVPNIGDTATAIDSRDGTEYMVGRLADGNVWLLDNLALDLTATGASTRITAANTNASATSLNALFNGVSGGGAGGNLARASVTSNWGMSYTNPAIAKDYMNMTISDFTDTSGSFDGDWPIGVYYNFCAASAGSYCYDEYSAENDATEDICPAGWRMPTGGIGGEYDSLYGYYRGESNPVEAFRLALHAPLSGESDYDGYRNVADDGEIWASNLEREHSVQMGILFVEDYMISYDSNYGRESGLSIRCVMDD